MIVRCVPLSAVVVAALAALPATAEDKPAAKPAPEVVKPAPRKPTEVNAIVCEVVKVGDGTITVKVNEQQMTRPGSGKTRPQYKTVQKDVDYKMTDYVKVLPEGARWSTPSLELSTLKAKDKVMIHLAEVKETVAGKKQTVVEVFEIEVPKTVAAASSTVKK